MKEIDQLKGERKQWFIEADRAKKEKEVFKARLEEASAKLAKLSNKTAKSTLLKAKLLQWRIKTKKTLIQMVSVPTLTLNNEFNN